MSNGLGGRSLQGAAESQTRTSLQFLDLQALCYWKAGLLLGSTRAEEEAIYKGYAAFTFQSMIRPITSGDVDLKTSLE